MQHNLDPIDHEVHFTTNSTALRGSIEIEHFAVHYDTYVGDDRFRLIQRSMAISSLLQFHLQHGIIVRTSRKWNVAITKYR